MRVGETMGLHSLELGQELGWVLQEELNIDVVGLVHVSQDTDKCFHSGDKFPWGGLGEDNIELFEGLHVDLSTSDFSSCLGGCWVLVGVYEFLFLSFDGSLKCSDVGFSFFLIDGVLLEFSIKVCLVLF